MEPVHVCTWYSDQEMAYLNPRSQISLPRMRNQRARSVPESILLLEMKRLEMKM